MFAPLDEHDTLERDSRALPPAEHHIVVVWVDSQAQLDWTRRTGLANVRLGDRPGTWHIPPEISTARHLLLRMHRGIVVPGLFRLRVPGYRVFTAGDLLEKGYPGAAGGEIYAVFEVEDDPLYANLTWDGDALMRLLEGFEARRQQRLPVPLGRTSAYPRVLSLRALLKAVVRVT